MKTLKSETSSGLFPISTGKPPKCADLVYLESEDKTAQKFEPQIQSMAWHYANGNYQLFEDLTQEGMMGLVNAYRNFKTDGGASFATYADRHIRGRMKNFVRSARRHNVCISWSEYQCLGAAEHEFELEQLHLTAVETMEAVQQFIVEIDMRFLRQTLDQVTQDFTANQLLMFRLRFVQGLTVGEIAAQLEVSAARVSQVLSKTVNKLQASFKRN